MPEFKVAKANQQTTLNETPLREDKLYIVKDNELYGKIFYDFDKETRLEISPTNINYKIAILSSDETINLSVNDLINLKNNALATDIRTVFLGDLVIAPKGIYYISNIESNNIELTRLYTQEYILWNDYYGEVNN